MASRFPLPGEKRIHKTDLSNKFRNEQNNLYAKELFVEYNTRPGVALYTLKRHDYKDCRSLYQLYMDLADLSEYSFANAYFEGWRHWEAIANSAWFSPYIDNWREELEVKVRATALATIVNQSKGTGKEAQTAARYIVERGWEKVSRGRPKKSPDILKEAERIAIEEQQIEDDSARISGMNVN